MPISSQERLYDLVKICESMTWYESPESISEQTVSALLEAVGCECASIHLLDTSGDYIVQWATCGMPTSYSVQHEERLSITTGRMQQIMKTHQPIVTDFQHPDPVDQIPSGPIDFDCAVSVPILAKDEVLGMFNLLFKDDDDLKSQDYDYLVDIGRVMGISVQHAKIAQKAIDLELLLERKRLSGELHDNFSQLISLLNMGVETAFLSLDEGELEKLRADLGRIKRAGDEASHMLREEMLSLRTSTDESENLVHKIVEGLERFAEQWGISTEFLPGENLEPLIVSKQTELQFLRILHEALSNVLRHADATNVIVSLYRNMDHLCMRIEDNGAGFNPNSVSRMRLGLRIMRERAESLGGSLTLKSSDGVGTTVFVDVPRCI